MKKHLLVALCALTFCSLALSQGRVQPPTEYKDLVVVQENSASIELSTDKTQFVRGEPVVLNITLRNEGTNVIRFTLDDADWFYQIDVVAPNGTKVPISEFHNRRVARTDNRIFQLFPGRSKTVKFHMNPLFDMTAVGKYKVAISKKFGGEGKAITVEALPITVEVTPPPALSEWQ